MRKGSAKEPKMVYGGIKIRKKEKRLSNKMDNSLLTVRDISHKYIVVGEDMVSGSDVVGWFPHKTLSPGKGGGMLILILSNPKPRDKILPRL